MHIRFSVFIFYLAITILLAFSILPHFITDNWIIDNLSHFKVQYIILSLLLLLFSLFARRRITAIILLLLVIIWNAYFIVPLYTGSTEEVPEGKEDFEISSVNLLSSNTNYDKVRDYIKQEDPDILVLLEFSEKWRNELISILKNYKHQTLLPRSDNFGIALLSKMEMTSKIDYFQLNNKPSIVGNFEIENKQLTIIATHPIPPVNQSTFENRNQQLENIMDSRFRFSENLIIIGDLNTSSYSPHFQKLVKNGLKDSRRGFGILPSWPADFMILQTTLDHCLISKNLQVVSRTTGENIGSDHLPINVKLALK